MSLSRQEKQIFEGGHTELSEVEERLYAIMVPEIKARAVKLDAFAGLRGKNVIDVDKKSIESLEDIFRQANSDSASQNQVKRGELLEAIVNDQIESSNWFGENTFAIVPSRYDDIKNGIDGILEFKAEKKDASIVLAFDVTKKTGEVENKLSGIKEAIEHNRLSKIKYFCSENGTVNREPLEVPRVIIGTDQRTMKDLSELLLLFKTRQKHPMAGKPGEFKKAREHLENHSIQFKLLLEIKIQLESFVYYSEKLGKTALAQKYKEVLKVIDDILIEKENCNDHRPDYEGLKNDNVYRTIVEKAQKTSFENLPSFKTFGRL